MTLAEFRKMSIDDIAQSWIRHRDLDQAYKYLGFDKHAAYTVHGWRGIFQKMSELSDVELLLLGLKADE